MNKIIFFIVCLFFVSSQAFALSVPSYIEDTDDIKENICKIIKEKTASGVAFEDTSLTTAEKDMIIMKAISSLYAEAFTTMTILSNSPSTVGNFVDTSSPIKATNKKEVLESEVQTKINSIAKRLNSIISLEAGIAELEGSMILKSLTNVQCSKDALSGEK